MKRIISILILLVIAYFGTSFKPDIKAPPQTNTKIEAEVLSIIDGDTILAKTPSGKEKIRLIGIDTPETDPSLGPVECYGQEATEKTTELLKGKRITLELDSSQDKRDVYDRLLAYVLLEDGTNINKMLVEQGYAREFTFKKPYHYQTDFKNAEDKAKKENLGVWNCQN